MIFPSKIFFGTLSLLLIFGGLSPGHSMAADNEEVKKVPWTIDMPPSASQWRTEENQARIVIFRLKRQNEKHELLPLNVFVNKDYHASLYPEHQAIGLSLCPGVNSLKVVPANRQHESAFELTTPGFQQGTAHFYQITMDDSGKSVGRWVEPAQAESVLANINIQTHTLSRVAAADCPYVPALFKLNQHNVDGMLPGTVDNLSRLAGTISDDYQEINQVVVIGHADPMGSDKRNQYLSEQRANTVMGQLIASGMPSDTIITRAMGSAVPVIPDCRKHGTRSERVDCNQPNRRVEVKVYGVRKDGMK